MKSKSSDTSMPGLRPLAIIFAQLREAIEARCGFFDQTHFVSLVCVLAVMTESSVTLQPPPNDQYNATAESACSRFD